MMQAVKITPALNGWIVKVGCQTIVSTDKSKLLKDLGEYMTNPNAKAKKFIAGAVNKELAECPTPPPVESLRPLSGPPVTSSMPTVR